MRIHEILTESRSADLYHGTNLAAAQEIMQDNVMHATTQKQDLRNIDQGEGVSFTRDFSIARRFGQYQGSRTDPPVVFVIDQLKLYQSVGKRMQAYAYPPEWGGEDDEPQASYRSQSDGEAEENVMGDIKNISSFIKQIIIFLPTGFTKKDLYTYFDKDILLTDPRTIIIRIGKNNISGRQFAELIKREFANPKSRTIIKK